MKDKSFSLKVLTGVLDLILVVGGIYVLYKADLFPITYKQNAGVQNQASISTVFSEVIIMREDDVREVQVIKVIEPVREVIVDTIKKIVEVVTVKEAVIVEPEVVAEETPIQDKETELSMAEDVIIKNLILDVSPPLGKPDLGGATPSAPTPPAPPPSPPPPGGGFYGF